MWKKQSSRILLDHPRITVVEDRVILPNGEETTYIRTPSKGNAAALIVRDKEKILVQKEYSYPINEEIFQFPGGFIPQAEDILQGANRELMEESGLKANKLTLLGKFLFNNRRSDSYMFIFLAEKLEEVQSSPDLEEKIENFWFTENQIDQMIRDGELKNGYSIASWMIYKLSQN